MEAALKDIRIDSQRFGEAVITLSTAGSRISNSVSSILGEPSAAVVTHALQPFPQAEDVQTGPSIENSEV
jgi:hypothetical protein